MAKSSRLKATGANTKSFEAFIDKAKNSAISNSLSAEHTEHPG